ncbi:Guanosine-3',5'-bis(diphosphate) 3'-pyrophosphohydrolase MESH1 [Gracilariopsis chorda]|uniref:Guanosine-3',5'-bis(diphosphate) 3'-pyrophosphohydrolase MESH1 n=1 Tax=Gracilariopsis chorda TaxID=448386 RepID=A0A2V3J254_9FLOR|nr:Guanosine-3',5'-bis(diphosphate) 3'-pyrophosphohydrolase MESH1 [Gracilariopsis chorda]|eukprot:PXF48536.1 Guanosine-3',5'-bis(diphosphate) 3'-pyrophosphohydrolase MESH1 [Gracilariopsis chorda]
MDKTSKADGQQETAQSVALLVRAMDYSAEKHKDQRRKNSNKHPYINHPVRVARRLIDAEINDVSIIAAALLHDTVEDTDATKEEIKNLFGAEIASIVDEVSDDKTLPKEVRKQLQIQHAPSISPQAKAIKLADKLDNLTELLEKTPIGWEPERVEQYFDWAKAVVDGLRGVNPALEQQLDEVFAKKADAARKACSSVA